VTDRGHVHNYFSTVISSVNGAFTRFSVKTKIL
jgi:hypothetical protein